MNGSMIVMIVVRRNNKNSKVSLKKNVGKCRSYQLLNIGG